MSGVSVRQEHQRAPSEGPWLDEAEHNVVHSDGQQRPLMTPAAGALPKKDADLVSSPEDQAAESDLSPDASAAGTASDAAIALSAAVLFAGVAKDPSGLAFLRQLSMEMQPRRQGIRMDPE